MQADVVGGAVEVGQSLWTQLMPVMSSVDLISFGGIAAGVTLLVFLVRLLWKSKIAGKEVGLAAVLSFVGAFGSKALGYGFADMTWMAMVPGSVGAMVTSGLIWDKLKLLLPSAIELTKGVSSGAISLATLGKYEVKEKEKTEE